MKKTLAGLLLLCATLMSCRAILAKKYGTNKPFDFKSKQEYFDYLDGKKHFEREHMIYLDAIDHAKIFSELGNPYSVYKGSFLNDSTFIKKSAYLMDNESCMGRMDGEIQKNIVRKQFVDSFLSRSTFLRDYHFYTSDNHPLKIDNGNKRLKVVLVYFYSQGSVYDYIYQEVYKTYAKSKKAFDLFIVCCDPVYHLPD